MSSLQDRAAYFSDVPDSAWPVAVDAPPPPCKRGRQDDDDDEVGSLDREVAEDGAEVESAGAPVAPLSGGAAASASGGAAPTAAADSVVAVRCGAGRGMAPPADGDGGRAAISRGKQPVAMRPPAKRPCQRIAPGSLRIATTGHRRRAIIDTSSDDEPSPEGGRPSGRQMARVTPLLRVVNR